MLALPDAVVDRTTPPRIRLVDSAIAYKFDQALLVGAAVYVAGMVTARVLPGRKRKPKPGEPVCGCGHHVAYHDLGAGACAQRIRLHHHYYDNCKCCQYSGGALEAARC
jgi:hypothetical protein